MEPNNFYGLTIKQDGYEYSLQRWLFVKFVEINGKFYSIDFAIWLAFQVMAGNYCFDSN
jgi:hypothetical protein